ncbi:MAG: hypothetical protein C0597_11270 [Marinilabiliales bacterium]|nr:MAG: hypothetical protein C0597_11270 [Marinilabiliales bacterium]
MVENFNQIDGVFRSKLGDYTESAPEGVWENIEGALNARKSAKRITFLRMAAAIAAFAVVGSSYLYLTKNNQENSKEQAVAEVNKKENILNNKAKDGLTYNEVEIASVEHLTADNNEQKILNANSEVSKDKPQNLFSEILIADNVQDKNQGNREGIEKVEQKEISLRFKKVEAVLIDPREEKINAVLNSMPDLYNSLAINNDLEALEKENTKWSVGGDFSPLYSYRYIAETGGTYTKDYYNNSENAIMSYTGGLNIQYKAIDRLTIQAGVYYTTMGQSIDYMAVYSNAAYNMVAEEYKDRFINSYNISNSTGEIAFNSPYVIVDEKLGRVDNLTDSKGVADVSDPIYSNLDAEIQQNFQYVEVPFLLRYKIIDKNIDLNLIGGFGANFLIGNDVYLRYGSNKEIIGETTGVNSINYNGTFGLGIEYPLFDRLNLKIEPSIKYYINEINSSSSVESHPYSIGIYTGFNYSF